MDKLKMALEERAKDRFQRNNHRFRIDPEEERINWRDIGGMAREKRMFKRMLKSLGTGEKPESNGYLIYGPGGCGKTFLMKAVKTEAKDKGISFYKISSAALYMDNQPKLRLDFIFQRAQVPSIIYLDKIETLAYADASGTEEARTSENPIFTYLAEKIDGLHDGIAVVVETNEPNLIPEFLLRSGRLESQLYFEPPDEKERAEVFKKYTEDEEKIPSLAEMTKGYTCADIKRISTTSEKIDLKKPLPIKSTLNRAEHANCSLFKRRHTREPMYVTDITWEDIGGLHDVKKAINFSIELIYNKRLQRKLGLDAPKGILLQGPPGCGKTMMAKAIANQQKVPLISLKGTDLLAKWLNWSVLRVREVFSEAIEKAPSIIFIDEIDSAVRRRGVEEGGSDAVVREVVGELLTQMDGLGEKEDVLVIAATNDPWAIDDALLRPGRFDKIIYVPPPNEEGRKEIINMVMSRAQIKHDIDIERIVAATDGYSGADIENIYNATITGLYITKNGRVRSINTDHWLETIRTVSPSISRHTLKYYENFRVIKRLDKHIPDMYT